MGNLYLKYRQGFPKNLDKVFIQKPDGTSITYQELENQSAAYANGFEVLGLEPGDRVTIQVEKCPEAIYIYLACLRANLIFHPLNTAYKETELSFFIDDARPSLFICTSDTYQNFPNLKISNSPKYVYTLHGQKEKPIQDIRIRDDHEVTDCSKDHTAALLYSSGTTGTPKGIMLSHGNIGSNALSLVQCWGFNEKDRLLHALPIYHVHGLFVALGCVLMSGSEINWLESFDTDSVLDLLTSSTVMMGVPTYYTRLLSSDKLDKEIVKNIRLFISGSAPLLEETFSQFKEKTGKHILERYGMTETNIISSNPVDGIRKPGTVGLPLKDQYVRIVNDTNDLLELGEIGNIQVKGDNVFSGYWNLPDKTKEDFSSDNFFNTGDKGYFDEEGYLIIVGRSKDMIISGGLNVYPKEVESYIDKITGVKESAVVGIKDDDLGERVVAVIVLENQSNMDPLTIIDHLKSQISGFKVPKEVFFLDELPRNAMGKVQKNILRDNYQ